MNHVDLAFDIERVEDRHAAVVEMHARRSLRCHDIKERLRAMERTFAVDHDAVDGRVDAIANSAQQNVAFGVEAARCAHCIHALVHDLP